MISDPSVPLVQLFTEFHPKVVEYDRLDELRFVDGNIAFFKGNSGYIQYFYLLQQVNYWLYSLHPAAFGPVLDEHRNAESFIRSYGHTTDLVSHKTTVARTLLAFQFVSTSGPMEDSISIELLFKKLSFFVDKMMACMMKSDWMMLCEEIIKGINHRKTCGLLLSYISMGELAYNMSQLIRDLMIVSKNKRTKMC